MDTAQLEHVLRQDKYVRNHFVAVCAHDQVREHIQRAFNTRHTAAIVFNLDPIQLPGSHWVAVFTDFRKGQAEYFGSTGLPPDPACRQLLLQVCPRGPLLYNKHKLQDDTVVCGQFATVFLKLRCRGFNFKECVNTMNFKDNDRTVYDLIKDSIPNLPYYAK